MSYRSYSLKGEGGGKQVGGFLLREDGLSDPNMCQSLFAVETECFQTAVTQHLEHLGIFLPFFFEGEFALFVVVLVFAATPVFTTLIEEDC